MHEKTKNTLCEVVIEGEDAALKELIKAADEKRHTDFWTITTNIGRLLDLDRRLGCT